MIFLPYSFSNIDETIFMSPVLLSCLQFGLADPAEFQQLPPPRLATFPTVDALDVWRQMGCLIEQFILLGVVVLRSLFDCNLFRYGFVELRNFCMVCLCIFSSIYLYISVV